MAAAIEGRGGRCAGRSDRRRPGRTSVVSKLQLQVMRLPHGADLPLPSYQSEGAAGLDLLAAVAADAPGIIAPGQRALIPTGLVIALPAGTEGQVRPRSGLAARHGVTVLNSPGTIDADYRGEIQVILVNLGQDSFTVTRGTRIAQLVIAPIQHVKLVEWNSLDATERASGGL